MANAGTIAVNLVARTEAFSKGMKRSGRIVRGFEKSTMSTMRTVRNFGIAAVAGTGAIVYGMSRLVKVASDAEEIMSKFNVVFRDLADESSKWASEFSMSVGRATQDVHKWMAGLQDTFVPLGFARDISAELSKELVKLAVDVGSFNNISDAEVIRDFTSALVGNHEAVRKYGIIITETSMKQAAMLKGLDPKNLTNLQKVQLRYNAILNATSDAQGDAVRTADSYANQVKRLQSNILNLKEAIGKELMPVMKLFVVKANEALSVFSKQDGLEKSINKAAIATTYLVDGFNIVRSVVNYIVGSVQKLIAISTVAPVQIASSFADLAEFLGMEGFSDMANAMSEAIDDVGKTMYDAGQKNIQQSIEQMKNIGKLREEMKDAFLKAEEVIKKTQSMSESIADTVTRSAKSKTGQGEVFRTSYINVQGLSSEEDEREKTNRILTAILDLQKRAFS